MSASTQPLLAEVHAAGRTVGQRRARRLQHLGVGRAASGSRGSRGRARTRRTTGAPPPTSPRRRPPRPRTRRRPAYSCSTTWSTSSRVTVSPEASVAPELSHCQIWLREISAVAASSMRLWMPTAPLPSQPRLEVLDADGDVGPQALHGPVARRGAGVEQVVGGDRDLVALPVELVGGVAEDAGEDLLAQLDHARVGHPRPVEPGRRPRAPCRPAPWRRRASLTAGSLLGMNAAMPPIAKAPRLWQVCTSRSL